MVFHLTINMDSDVFADNPAAALSETLHAIAESVADEVPTMFQTVRDGNGNSIGSFAAKRTGHYRLVAK